MRVKLNKSEGYISERVNKGKSCEEIIDSVLDKDYRNIQWFSDSDLSVKLGKSAPYVKRHLANGETHKQIIDYILDKQIINTH